LIHRRIMAPEQMQALGEGASENRKTNQLIGAEND
jgi:hypothetical protein